MTDNEIVSHILKGNTKFFEILIDRYQIPIFNLTYKMTRVTEDAEDLTQIVFIKAYENLDQYVSKYKFFSWLYRIGINETLNYINSSKRINELDESSVSDKKDPMNILDQKELGDKINEAIAQLDKQYSELIILKHIQDYSYDEISKILDLDVKKVKSRLYSARQMLKDILSKQGILND